MPIITSAERFNIQSPNVMLICLVTYVVAGGGDKRIFEQRLGTYANAAGLTDYEARAKVVRHVNVLVNQRMREMGIPIQPINP